MKARAAIGVVALAVATIAALSLVPSVAWTDFGAPATGAIYAYLATLIGLAVTRALGASRAERVLLAVFLASMPLVYIGGSLRAGGEGLAVELAGFVVFGTLAALGFRRPWILAAGIALHGIGWDLWHVPYGSAVPSWYAWACLIIDLGIAAYAADRWMLTDRSPRRHP